MTTERREQLWVGAFVLMAVAALVGVVLSVSGAFAVRGTPHHASFKFAGGLAPGAPVRYGGLSAGKVESLRVDPGDSTRIQIDFRVNDGIPVKTDSVVKVASVSPLAEPYLEVTTGTSGAPLSPPGSELKSREMLTLSDLGDTIGGIAPLAEAALHSLNERLVESKVTIARINDVLGDQNRNNISASLTNLNAMLAETRPRVAATLANVQEATESIPKVSKNVLAATEKLSPLMADLKATIKQGNQTIAQLDAILQENRPEIRASMVGIRKTMDTASQAVELLKATLERNGDNLDDSLANVRVATDNLRQMTDSLKRNPSVLIRGETGKDRMPGATK